MSTGVTFITLNELGTGVIQAGDNQQERLEEFTNRVGSGEFHAETNGVIPCKCIDGRCGGHGALMPNSAGGSETLMVADDLTTKNFALNGDSSTVGQFKETLRFLKEAGNSVGGHTAANLHGAPSGCGANDKLPAIYAYMAQGADQLRAVATGVLGYEISDEDHALIINNAAARTDFSAGDEVLANLKEQGGEDCVDVLQGAHTEVIAVINRRLGTTLDRDAIQAEFGDDYEAFNVDEWSFNEGARLISQTGVAEQRQKRIAMLYYNLATAGVLCGPGMRVTVLN